MLKVSLFAVVEGEIQIMKAIFPFPFKLSLKTRVNFEFLNGMCVLDFSIKALIQCPRVDKDPLIYVNS